MLIQAFLSVALFGAILVQTLSHAQAGGAMTTEAAALLSTEAASLAVPPIRQ